MYPTNTQIEKLICDIKQKYSVEINLCDSSRFENNRICAITDCVKEIIYFNNKYLKKPLSYILKIILHECGHIHCLRNNLFKCYHNTKEIHLYTAEEKRIIVFTALKAERYVDRWAAYELKK